MPGIGHFDTRLVWIRLPPGTDRTFASQPTTGWSARPLPVRSQPSVLSPLPVDPEQRTAWARQRNAEGLRRHVQGAVDAAAALFWEALRYDPGHHAARFNLACAATHLGLHDRALALLEELAAPGCADCVPWLRRAVVDPDLAPQKPSCGMSRSRQVARHAGYHSAGRARGWLQWTLGKPPCTQSRSAVADATLRLEISGELWDFSDFEDGVALHLGVGGAF